jgi:hypothetical protein
MEAKINELVIKLREELSTYECIYITDKELESRDDVIYDTPRIWDVSKYLYHEEYVMISIKDGIIRTQCISEGNDSERNFSLSEITTDELLSIR